jgi:hypothetical protein
MEDHQVRRRHGCHRAIAQPQATRNLNDDARERRRSNMRGQGGCTDASGARTPETFARPVRIKSTKILEMPQVYHDVDRN